MIPTILIKLVTKIFGFKKTHWKIYKTLLIIITPLLIITIATSFSLDLQAAGLSNGLDAFNLSMNGTPTVNSQGTQAILDWAKVIAEYMRDNHYFYPKDKEGNLRPNLPGISYDNRYNDGKSKACCCATYVSWVLQEAGLIDKHTNGVKEINTWLGNDKENWKLIDTIIQIEECEDKEKCFQPGDILIFDVSAHVNIYAGDGKFWDAGDDRYIEDERNGAFKGYAKTSNPFSDFISHPYSYAYRYIGK